MNHFVSKMGDQINTHDLLQKDNELIDPSSLSKQLIEVMKLNQLPTKTQNVSDLIICLCIGEI